MSFAYPWVLVLIALPFLLFLLFKGSLQNLEQYFNKELLNKMQSKSGGLSKKARSYILALSFIFGILAISRPYIDNGKITIKQEKTTLISAFDISQSMLAQDLYPNRLEFAKKKFFALLQYLKNVEVGAIAFSQRAFLIAPLTQDYETLRYLVKNLNLDYVSLKGTNILSALKVANELLKKQKEKALLLFSDGGDKSDFSKEIAYAKEHHIKVFVYAVASKKGAVIPKRGGGVVKDSKGEIVISRLNEAIKDLALQSGGAYIHYTISNEDMAKLAEILQKNLKTKEVGKKVIHDKKELFYYPLFIAIVLFFVALFSLPRRGQ